jgi:hypothetical protein
MKIVIVGAGIGGLAARLVCRRAGTASQELCAAIKKSSVPESMRAQEGLLEEGPFG